LLLAQLGPVFMLLDCSGVTVIPIELLGNHSYSNLYND
jgi:hypothetical protein